MSKFKNYIIESNKKELEKISPKDFVKKLQELIKNSCMELENKYDPGVKFRVNLQIDTISDNPIHFMCEVKE